MSSTKYVNGNLIAELKNKNSLSFNIFDSEKILFEKNEALKDLELNDDIIDNTNVKIKDENKFDLDNNNEKKKKVVLFKEKKVWLKIVILL